MIKWYLAGPIQSVNDYHVWRTKLTKWLEKKGYIVFNPLTKYEGKTESYKNMVANLLKENKMESLRDFVRGLIISPDFKYVEEADIIIAYLPKDTKPFGTIAEMSYGYNEGKIILVVTDIEPAEYSAWMVGLSTRIFKDFDELQKYIEETFP